MKIQQFFYLCKNNFYLFQVNYGFFQLSGRYFTDACGGNRSWSGGIEGYGNDNPGAKSQGIKQLMAGGGVVLIGTQLIPLLSGLF